MSAGVHTLPCFWRRNARKPVILSW